ncbi:MAG: methyltransferase domain-containing protein, partial [Pseudomonadota bacterium]
MTTPKIFDRAAILRTLTSGRSFRDTAAPHPVVTRVEEDVIDRVAGVLRDFPKGVVMAPFPTRLAAGLTGLDRVGTVSVAAVLGDIPGAQAIMDDEALPLADQSIDLLISLLSLQAANDLPGALIQARRALQPDGLFLAV